MKHPHFTLLYTEANESMKLGGGVPPLLRVHQRASCS